jgi:parallel beta-helix repeat protein/predicted outer membrane repeat protein
VTSIDRGLAKEGQVILDTEFATLEEAIQKGHWEYDHTLKPEDIEKGFVFPEGIRPVRGKASTTLDFEYDINVILYDKDDNPDTTEDNIMATGYLAFNYQIIFDGDIDGFTLKHFIFENIIQTDSKLDISVGGLVSIDDLADVGDVTIGKPIPFTPVTVLIPTPIGIPIPLVFFPSIELKAGIEGEAHIVLETGIRQIATYTAGIEFTEGNWQNITTSPQVDYYDYPIEVYDGIHVIAHAGPQLNCKLYKVAGPYCNIFGYLDFEADTTLDPWWDMDAMLKVFAGVKLDILTIHWASGELELINLSRDIIDAGGPFGGTGPVHNLTKDTYYNTIQSALDAADSGDTIEVFPGTYYENINFMGKNIVLRSTDPKNPTVVTSTIIDGGKNGSVVTFRNSETNQARLEGFTIQNGRGIYEDEHTVRDGGGIFVDHSSPSIIGNIIVGNTAEGYGGGIAVLYGSSPTIIENTISGNTAERYGGGISVWGSSPTITGNTISRNKSDNAGGGIFAGGGSSPIINNNSISGNTAEGHAIWWNFTSTITGNTINENTANVGGGIWVGESDPNINNNTISGNTAEVYGGGIYVGKDASVKTATGNEWLRNNVPPNKENTNTYSGNTHGNPPGYTEGADVYFETLASAVLVQGIPNFQLFRP